MSPDRGLQGALQPSPRTQPAAAVISSSWRWAPAASARRAWRAVWWAPSFTWWAPGCTWWAPGCTWWAPRCKWWAPCASTKAPSVSALPPLPPPLPPPPLPPPLLLPPLPLLLRSVAPCGPPRGSSGVLQSAVGYRSSVAASTQQSPAPPPSQQSLGVPVGVTQLLPPPLPPPPSQQGVVGLRVGVELAGTPLQVPVPVPVLATAPLPTPVPALLPLPVPVPAQVPVAVGKPALGALLQQPVPGAAGRPMQALPIRSVTTAGDSQSLSSSSSSSSRYWYDDCCAMTGANIASPSAA